jgi:endo-1,4-beta-xylanase
MFPDYLLPGQTGSSCGTRTSASLLPLIQGRMNSILTYNPSVINAINVVNEEFVGAGYGLNCYRTIIGAPLFIDKAFQYARAADPHATLVLNEAFYNEAIDAFQYAIDRYEIDFVFNYVKDAKKRGIPIDAVGVQNHLNVDSGIHFTQQYLDDLDYLFAKARDAGVKVIFTEMEVYQTRGKTQTDVATVYKNTMAKCLTNSNCLGIYFWGISDKFGASGTNSTLFDASYNRKPAYNAVMDALRENTTRGCTGIPVTATPTPIRIPGDITDVGDVPGDQVNIFDYNLVLSNFGNPYTIFDYNNVIANFGK